MLARLVETKNEIEKYSQRPEDERKKEIESIQNDYVRKKKNLNRKEELVSELMEQRNKTEFYKECALLAAELKGLKDQNLVLKQKLSVIK